MSYFGYGAGNGGGMYASFIPGAQPGGMPPMRSVSPSPAHRIHAAAMPSVPHQQQQQQQTMHASGTQGYTRTESARTAASPIGSFHSMASQQGNVFGSGAGAPSAQPYGAPAFRGPSPTPGISFQPQYQHSFQPQQQQQQQQQFFRPPPPQPFAGWGQNGAGASASAWPQQSTGGSFHEQPSAASATFAQAHALQVSQSASQAPSYHGNAYGRYGGANGPFGPPGAGYRRFAPSDSASASTASTVSQPASSRRLGPSASAVSTPRDNGDATTIFRDLAETLQADAPSKAAERVMRSPAPMRPNGQPGYGGPAQQQQQQQAYVAQPAPMYQQPMPVVAQPQVEQTAVEAPVQPQPLETNAAASPFVPVAAEPAPAAEPVVTESSEAESEADDLSSGLVTPPMQVEDGVPPSPAILTPAKRRGRDEKVGVDDFEPIKLLGRGGFSKVYLVRKRDSGEIFAMKVVRKKTAMRETKGVEYCERERKVLEEMDHPFIVGLRYSFQTRQRIYMVLDFATGGELYYQLRRRMFFPEHVVQFYAAEIVLAFEWLHKHGIIYRDLKPENVCFDRLGHVLITDFGLAKEQIFHDHSRRAHSFCGTAEYMAPEMVTQSGHAGGVDWWSLGVIIYELLVGRAPFKSNTHQTNEVLHNILVQELYLPNSLSQNARSIITALLQRDVSKRLGTRGDAAEVRDHPFFAGVDWAALLEKRVNPPLQPIIEDEVDTSNFDPAVQASVKDSGNESDEDDPYFDSNLYLFKGFRFDEDYEHKRARSPAFRRGPQSSHFAPSSSSLQRPVHHHQPYQNGHAHQQQQQQQQQMSYAQAYAQAYAHNGVQHQHQQHQHQQRDVAPPPPQAQPMRAVHPSVQHLRSDGAAASPPMSPMHSHAPMSPMHGGHLRHGPQTVRFGFV